jgi:Family of unknown function (DUF5678)/Aspartyl protease
MEHTKQHKLNNWVNDNRALLKGYIGKWIAYTENGLIASADTIDAVIEKANEIDQKHVVFFVNPNYFQGVRFRPIHFRSIVLNDWLPLYQVELRFNTVKIQVPMLIDSGADGSLITYSTGLKLGLSVADGETRQTSKGIGGGEISYVWRDIDVTIAGHALTIPMAWILSGENQEEIIGRHGIFDAFDIEFKQADQEILFKKRPNKVPAAHP